jgi:hypothetical protein
MRAISASTPTTLEERPATGPLGLQCPRSLEWTYSGEQDGTNSGKRFSVVGITTRPDEVWLLQVAPNLIDEESGALAAKRYLIVDRDTKYTQQFRRWVEEGGTEVTFVGQASLRRAIGEYMAHHHDERNHQGLANSLIQPAPQRPAKTALIRAVRD